MKNIIKRSIVCLIALAGSVFGGITASAADGKTEIAASLVTEYEQDNFSAAEMKDLWRLAVTPNDHTIILKKDWELDEMLTVTGGNSVTIDLNGFKIDRDLLKYEANGALFKVENNARLTIKDSYPERTHKGCSVSGGILTGGRGSDCAGCIEMEKGSKVHLEGCSIISCVSRQDGGAIRMNGVCELIATGTSFCSNYAIESTDRCYGGAVYVGDGTAKIINCVFDGNYSEDHGGAIYMNDGELQVQSTMFRSNSSGKDGGAIYCNGTHNNSMIQSSTFVSNKAEGSGGAVYVDDCKQLVMYNTVFSLNHSSENGGAVFVDSDRVVLANTTVTSNKAEKNGGGVYVDSLRDIGVQGKVVIRSNTNSTGENNDLCLQSGLTSTAHLSNGGLYEGSMIYVTSTTKDKILAAKEISKFQSSRYIRANSGSTVFNDPGAKQVNEKFVSSVLGTGSKIVIAFGTGAVVLTAVIIMIRKKRTKGAK